MAKRKPKPRTFDNATGAALGSAQDFNAVFGDAPDGLNTPGGPIVWFPSSDPDLVQAVVPNGTQLPADGTVIGARVDVPSAGLTTWYAATTAAMLRGRVQAATDTIAATGERIASVASNIGANLGPILLGIAALFLLYEFRRSK